MGPWDIGISLYRLFAVLSVLGMVLIIYIAVQPPNDKVLWIVLAFLVLTAILWVLFENRRFQGPPIGDMITKRQAEIVAAEKAVGEISYRRSNHCPRGPPRGACQSREPALCGRAPPSSAPGQRSGGHDTHGLACRRLRISCDAVARDTFLDNGASRMPGMLTFKELRAAVAAGEIDTVVVCFPDMQGRLIGKRFQAEYFLDGAHDETHGCDYLLANDIDMEPVPGYAAANWEKGYGDFVMKPDLATLRRLPWLPGTALVLCDILDHHHHEDVPHAPRAILKKQIARLAAMKMSAFFASELEFYLFDESYESAPGEGLSRPQDGRRAISRTTTSSRPPRKRG